MSVVGRSQFTGRYGALSFGGDRVNSGFSYGYFRVFASGTHERMQFGAGLFRLYAKQVHAHPALRTVRSDDRI